MIRVRIHGREYPSQVAAAKALGVSRHAIWLAIEQGREDSVGRRAKPTLCKPCTINGTRYGSRTEAAEALGVTVSAISVALRRGRHQVRPQGGKGAA
jgi:DNA-binding transcriptional LysR family regulator